ncbi:hypothetical protein DMUE_3981 [Dictyocoela muelleri]|nr:hypothetical protein DMUE_3981 [Dictyocoela muelleri]
MTTNDINIEMVIGRKVKSNKMIELELIILGDKDTKYITKAYIIKNMITNLILSIDFLLENDAIINPKNLTHSLIVFTILIMLVNRMIQISILPIRLKYL